MVNRGDDQTDRLIDEDIKKHGLPLETWVMAAASACAVDLGANRVTFSQAKTRTGPDRCR